MSIQPIQPLIYAIMATLLLEHTGDFTGPVWVAIGVAVAAFMKHIRDDLQTSPFACLPILAA